MKALRELIKLLILFYIGGFIYYDLEILFRGYSHWSMFIVGGIAFVLIGGINIWFTWEMPLWKQCIIATFIILVLELISGYIVNIQLGLNVWDYSNLPCNLLGQISLPYTVIWYVLSVVAIFLDDYIRWIIFKEEKPHYKLLT